MMKKARRDFTDAFKPEAVALVEASAQPLVPIANAGGIAPSLQRRKAAGVRQSGIAEPP